MLRLFIVSLVLIAAKPADRSDASVVRARSVEAQDFILKDADDQVRARLSLNSTNKVEINGRIFLLRAPSGPALGTAPQKSTRMPAR